MQVAAEAPRHHCWRGTERGKGRVSSVDRLSRWIGRRYDVVAVAKSSNRAVTLSGSNAFSAHTGFGGHGQ